MPETRESALLDVQTAVSRLAEADELLAARLADAIERACTAATATWPQAAEPRQTPDPEAIARVSGPLACFARCLPIALEGDTVVVLAAEPIDLQALGLLEAHAGSVRVVTAPAEVVWRGLESAYSGTAKKSRKKAVAEVAGSYEPPLAQPLSTAAESEAGQDLQAASAIDVPSPTPVGEGQGGGPETLPADSTQTPLTQPLSSASESHADQVLQAQKGGAGEPSAPAVIPPSADLLAAFEGAVELVPAQPEKPLTLDADDIAALFSAAEASASPVEPEPEVEPEEPSLDSQFEELMAEVQNGTSQPTDIHEPRTQNLDLLSAFEGLSEPVALSEKPVVHEVDLTAINTDAISDDLELDASDDPEVITAQVKRIALLLHEDKGGDNLAALVPVELALAAMCAPIAVDGDDLICLIEEPPNLAASEAVAEAAQMALRLQLSCREKVLARLHEIYGDFDENAMPVSNEAKPDKESLFAKIKGKFKKAA